MKKRRLMALLLSVCVGVSMLPMMAFADDGAAGEATPTAEDETKPTKTMRSISSMKRVNMMK